jgi:uncharacterized protein YjbI with pentapeptide repeats
VTLPDGVTDADLFRANLEGANLRQVQSMGANYSETNLRSVDLSGANLYGVCLFVTDLTGAVAEQGTRWPDGFDPEAAGVIFKASDSPPA